MELDHEFTVPVPVDQAWSVLLDVERVALCVPGATLDSADGEEYAGRLKVKVGAMTVTYRGTARIAVADRDARAVTIEAAAKEARGPGTAAATVQARLHDEGDHTRVTVHTKLNVTGRPAQFGRNILAEVGAKLIARFAKNLAAELENPTVREEAEVVDQQGAAEVAREAAVDRAEGEKAAESVVERAAEPVETAEPAPEPDESPVEAPAAAVPQPSVEATEPTETAETAETAETVREPVRPVTPVRRQDDAIDLLEFAGPSLARRAAPAAGALVALLLAVRFLVRRRRR
ncbi:SRPBCC family protein [Actinomadura namibiensis]|uniref:Carbon monoxide dehydrogenase subunit G n=2 Tax=Actinomadura TaxID=1988 RepID=A0A7W3LUE1_ACTNM|nr:SRPBCC family protein [Actinomadura namibiensis]MBA8954471.1 carbon monoxide dehydrogenase subunit G [Actinomadura namibiensis]